MGIFREYWNKCFWRPKAQVGIFREYRNKCFWRPKCFGKAPPQIMPLRILSGKGAVQIMPFRKLGGKCHFLLRFCMRKWSETYIVSSCRGFNFLPHYLSRAPHSTQRTLRSCTLSVWYLGQECKSVVWTLNTHTNSLFDYIGHSIIQSSLICISCTGQSASEIVTARQRSWGSLMFSRVSVCHNVEGTVILSGGGSHVNITHNTLNLTV